jgi:hypothetical protein
MTIRRHAQAPEPVHDALAAFLMREELAFRCLRQRLAAVLDPGPGAGFSGTLSGFPEPGTRRSPNQA